MQQRSGCNDEHGRANKKLHQEQRNNSETQGSLPLSCHYVQRDSVSNMQWSKCAHFKPALAAAALCTFDMRARGGGFEKESWN
jgi:hypothetical protein